MKSSITVISQGPEIGHSATAVATVHFKELTQVEIEYAMRKEDACRAALAEHKAKQRETQGWAAEPYILPGPGWLAV